MSNKEKIILELHRIGAIKFGEFKLKSGLISPFYIDLRIIVSYPELMNLICDEIINLTKNLEFDILTGIPYTALPIASIVSTKISKPLIYIRKEEKAYGTSKKIEGIYREGQKCLVIDDVMTTGESKFEQAAELESCGVKVKDFIIVVDRSNGGKDELAKKGYNLISIVTIKDVVDVLKENNILSNEQVNTILNFVNQKTTTNKISLQDIKEKTSNELTKKLIDLMYKKQTNLVLSLDVDNSKDFFDIIEKTGDEIVMLKTHIDIYEDFAWSFVTKLQKLAKEKEFFIFEDRKFADIGNTVRKQYQSGIYKISEWAEFVTVHGIPGEGILKGLFENLSIPRSCFLLSSMSSAGNLITDTYTRKIIEMGKKYSKNVTGFIGFGPNKDEIKKLKQKMPSDMLLAMPGVNLEATGDNLGQRYITVEEAVLGGADLIIVGRGIYGKGDFKENAKRYKEAGWSALMKRENNI
ncbi:MAG TPA: orotidine-5'-phosphate decarboxylase [Ignavibacteriales bacterium]|nr:orotidine-5'-phosphate decarboxylase [Ignavibacteriales bacterium]HOL81108.1 orotidine-5'-phosphate decarboxylase [Ignavibacteriales bacterium]HOM65212.1 orotidine-5'-phosphate decarboxylase [Ignavibacteriales bacterium]HPD66504.1 orotidine-5'-phosphate decarboxylase [Ignavibacteriales bacterium]HPP33536.1 orotidine-5'-phosphate decarboxylase [Ignavibacteriales bacterium]